MDIFKKLFRQVEEGVANLQRDAKVKHWLDEIGEAQKRERTWRKEAQRVVDLYEQKSSSDDSAKPAIFNILYANTETLAPAVYNNIPRPVVKRKVDKQNPLAVAAAQVLKHTLTYLTDTGDQGETSFDELQKIAVLEALVPGRGLARFSYEGKVQGKVEYECVYGDPVPWNRVVFGYAKEWAKVPWLAFEHFMTKEELAANFDEKIAAKIKLTHAPSDDKDQEGNEGSKGPEDAEGAKFAHIWEIWDKRDRKVKFISEGHPTIIEEREDPLRLDAFFSIPRPIQFLQRVSSLVPQTLYLLYEDQAKELEDVTRRIGALTRAMKIRGFYDGTLEGLEELLSKPENTLLPARNVNAMQNGQTLEKAIWLMPLQELISVLQQLYLNRQQIIGVIHQITGIADIMRGASAASETLGAQKMKEAWGTMRLKRMQKEVQRFTRDCYRLQAEIACKHFSVETFIAMTGLKFPRMVEKQQAQVAMQQLQMEADQLQAMAQSGQVPPEQLKATGQQLDQRAKQAQAVLGQPSWEEVVQFLQQDSIRNFVIDIETNSTIDIEATEDKQELAEMMNSMSQLLNGVLPMVKEGILPFDAAKALLLNVVQKFRLGDEVEETFRAMQQPQPKADPAAQKVEAEMKRDQQKFEMEQQDRQAEAAQKKELAAMELQVERERLEIQREQNRLDREMMVAKHQMEMQKLQAQTIAKTVPAAAPAQPQEASNANV